MLASWWGGSARLGAALVVAAAAWAAPEDRNPHWPLPAGELERILALEDFEIRSVAGEVGGVMGVRKLALAFPGSGHELTTKWKRAPDGDADGWNNTPRKEIAAYELQKWFLDPADYVVPTIVLRCIPPSVYRPIEAEPRPNLPGTECVTGVLVIWIDSVGIDGPIYEEERFQQDDRYARYMADLNLLTYLIEHEDGRRNNFLTADDATDRRIFSIDNSISFGAKVTNWFVPNWHVIRVPALRRQSIERLHGVSGEQLDALGVVAELRAGSDGILRRVQPAANADPTRGARVEAGWIQMGLTRREIGGLRDRINRLLSRVESGELPLL